MSPDRAGYSTDKVLIITASVGAGHDGAAHELADRLRRAGVDVDVRDYLQALPRWCRKLLSECYYSSVEHTPFLFEWVYTTIETSRLACALMRVFCRLGNRTIAAWVGAGDYGAVVSTYPLASQGLGVLRDSGRITLPVVTYLTDPAPHRTWVHPAVDLHLTVTIGTAQRGASDYGIPMIVGGPLVPRKFGHTPTPGRIAELRGELGLPVDEPVALLATGSVGLGDIAASAHDALDAGVIPVVLCGHNEDLRQRLSTMVGIIALGWRVDVHELMHLADVLVQNAGGLTFTEAMVAGLPTISYRCLPGHGQANAAALERADLAPWARDRDQFAVLLPLHAARVRTPRHYDDPARHILGLLGVGSLPREVPDHPIGQYAFR